MRRIFVSICLFCTVALLQAQQNTVVSNYDVASGLFNPAYQGLNRYLRIDAVSRIQWANTPGGPRFTGINFQTPVNKDFALGVGLQSIQVGHFKSASPVSVNSMNADLAYHKQLSKSVFLSVGVRLGYFNYAIQLSKLASNTPGDVAVGGNDISINAPLVGGGTMLYGKNFYIGVAMPQFTIAAETQLKNVNLNYLSSPYYLMSFGYVKKFNSNFGVKFTGLVKSYKAVKTQFDVNTYFLYKDNFQLGYGFRNTGTHSILCNLRMNEFFKILYSYEFGNSQIMQIPMNAHEFGLSYLINQPKDRSTIIPRNY